MMKAIVYSHYGSPDELKLEEVEKPVPKEGEVLVKVHTSSINSWDADLVSGIPRIYRLLFGVFKPRNKVIGCDVAGSVAVIGKGVTRFIQGDGVLADISGNGFGGFAEYACVPENLLVHKPNSLTYAEAACIPQAALLAYQGFQFGGGIQPGQRVLINGAGGGVGTFAIQLAKVYGAHVTAVDLSEKSKLLSELGADVVLEYPDVDFTQTAERYDFILDVMSRHTTSDYKKILKPGGVCGIVGGKVGSLINIAIFGSMQRKYKIGLVVHRPGSAELNKVIDLIQSHHIKSIIHREYPLSETADAMRYFMTGRVRGKVVIHSS